MPRMLFEIGRQSGENPQFIYMGVIVICGASKNGSPMQLQRRTTLVVRRRLVRQSFTS